LQFDLQLPPEISAVSLDKDLIRIALNNLLTNAIKYNQPGGRVVVRAEENDDEILVRVTDTGIGIEAEDQARIFDKFYRSENEQVRQRTGHGLGLSLAREIVQLHYGKLEVSSQAGRGSEFTMRFKKELGVLKQAI
jgi:signal transduction histidine kinase